MGCWNTTCGISNLPIHAGEEVVVFLLTENKFENSFVYSDAYFKPCLLPFYGKYNDYGAVEECYGEGLPAILEALKKKLTELPLGENKYHDLAVEREGLTIEKVFDLDHDNRLFISGRFREGDKNSGDQKRYPLHWGERVVHVQIKRSIFDFILENWTQEKWSGSGRPYTVYKFSDILNDLPGLIRTAEAQAELLGLRLASRGLDAENLASGYLWERLGCTLLPMYEMDFSLWSEALKGGFINSFMGETRKAWIKPIGNGSQTTDADPYRLLIDGMTKVLDTEKREFEDEEN